MSERPVPVRVVLLGELTAATSRTLHGRMRRLVEDGARVVVVDCAGVRRADAAGVAVLLVYARLLPPLGGELVIEDASPAVEDVLASVHLTRLLAQTGRGIGPPTAPTVVPCSRTPCSRPS